MVGLSLILINRLIICSEIAIDVMEQQNVIQLCLFLFDLSTDDSIRSQAVRCISILCRLVRVRVGVYRKD
jgi:hypothetical protein